MKRIETIEACRKDKRHFEASIDDKERKRLHHLIDVGLKPAREHTSCRVADALEDSFVYLYTHRNHESPEIRIITENFVQLYNQTIDLFSQHGVQEVICELLPMFRNVRLSELLPGLAREQRLFARAGFDHKTVSVYGEFLDQHLAESIALVEQGDFSMDLLKLPDDCGYLGPHEGNSWDGFVGFLSGAVTVADVACSIPTAGLAATSVVVGTVGGIYAITK